MELPEKDRTIFGTKKAIDMTASIAFYIYAYSYAIALTAFARRETFLAALFL